MIDDSLMGSAAEDIRAKIEEIGASLVRASGLRAALPDFETRKESLKVFAETIARQPASSAAA